MGGASGKKKEVTPWHTGPEWASFLAQYDAIARAELGDFTPRLVPTAFGETHVFERGPADGEAVVFFHGAKATSLSWSDVTKLPELAARRVVLVDYISDAGRSVPVKAPKNNEDHVQWVREILQGLGIKECDIVGFSFGALIAAMVASAAPDLVKGKRVVISSPAGVFEVITGAFLYHAMMPHMMPSCCGFDHDWLWNWQSAPSYRYEEHTRREVRQLHLSIDALDMREFMLGMMPYRFEDAELSKLVENCRASLIMSEFENVTDGVKAIARAKALGLEVIVVKDTGHICIIEKPQVFAEHVGKLLSQQ